MFSLHKLQKFLLKHIFLVSSISQINRLLFLFLLIASPCSDCITNKYKCICKRGKSFQETFYFYFLWVNNASTSFFTHFHSINFIYTAYFAKNYFIFTSYMKYFCLWRVSIVTGIPVISVFGAYIIYRIHFFQRQLFSFSPAWKHATKAKAIW